MTKTYELSLLVRLFSRPVYTRNFAAIFIVRFCPFDSLDVNEWINNECAERIFLCDISLAAKYYQLV